FLARSRVVDRALERRDPDGEARQWRPVLAPQQLPRALETRGGGLRDAQRQRARRGLDALAANQIRDELAEHHRVAVGHEVDAAGESGRRGVVSSTLTSGWPAIRAASVPTCTKRGTPAPRAAASAFLVPCTVTRSKSAGSPKSSTFAAAWWKTSAPWAPCCIA